MKLHQSVRSAIFFLVAAATSTRLVVSAQNYQDYGDEQDDYYEYNQQGQDNLYQDYAQHQEMKAQGGAGGGMMKTLAFSTASWFIGGKIHSKRAVKKANKKSNEELRGLYSKYVQDVTALQNHNAELQAFITQSTKQQLAEEFLQADVDNNKQVSRAEYELHKKQYLQKHPEFVGAFPRFEDFDPDNNGMITMREHEGYYEQRGMV